jgi:hypothetical protein
MSAPKPTPHRPASDPLLDAVGAKQAKNADELIATTFIIR